MSKSGLACAIGVATLLALAFWLPAFLAPDATGQGDWQMIHHNWEVGWVALTRFGEWPLWDPYHCGGVTMLGNPESQHFTPWFLVSLLGRTSAATTIATKLMLAAHTVIGFVGMLAYTRGALRLSLPAAWLAAVAWTFSGFFAWHGAGGHGTFLGFDYLPLLLFAWRRSLVDVRAAVGVAALLALTVAEGGTYPLPYMALALGLEALLLMRRPEARRGSVIAALVVGALFPLLEALRRFPREMVSIDRMSIPDVVLALTAHKHEWRWLGHEFVWPEYGAFVGWTVLALAGVGVLLALPRRARTHPLRAATLGAALGALIFLALVMGNGALRPWPLLHQLPMFDSLRVPSRFFGVATFYVSLLAAYGLDRIARVGGTRRLARFALMSLTWMVVLMAAMDITAATREIVDRWKAPPIAAPIPAPRFHFENVPDYYNHYAQLPRENIGTSSCYEGAMRWKVAPGLWVGDVPQARVAAPGQVLESRRTPSHLIAELNLPRATRVVWNSNFDPGWQPSRGTLVEDAGRLAVEAPAGRYRLDVRFRPPLLGRSLGLSALGVVLALALIFSRRLRRVLRLERPMR